MPWWRQPFTLIWVPHDGGPSRSFSVRWITVLVTGTLGLLFLAAGVGLGTYSLMTHLEASAAETSNRRATRNADPTKRRLSQQIQALKTQLARSRRLHQSVMKLSGFTQFKLPEDRRGGAADAGSGAEEPTQQDHLDRLLERNQQLEKLRQFVRSRNKVFQHTPMLWPVEGWLTSPYGYRQDPMGGEGRSFHDGVDIAAWHGTPVRAGADGVVTYAGWKSGYGRMIRVRHEYGYTTRYAHLSERLVDKGEEVRKGQIIGRVGSSGHSTGSHVHYEVRVNNETINPWPYLVQRFETYQAYASREGASHHAGTGS